MRLTKVILKELIYKVNGAAIEVHKALGPGLLEGIYHKCMKIELINRGLSFKSEVTVPIKYKQEILNAELRCDLLVEEVLVVELKAVERMHPVFDAQILSYMNLLNVPEGILINFNVTNIYKEGQKTFVNELYRNLPDN